MNIEKVKFFDGKKFMNDGKIYDTEQQANEILKIYASVLGTSEKDGFETRKIQEENKYLIYTRRVVKEIKIES